MDKYTIPENFTLPLVLVDTIPVIFFTINMILLGQMFESPLFILGALLCFFGGAGKVIWKLIVVLKKKNVWFLFVQLRILMPIGFLMILLSLFIQRANLSIPALVTGFLSMPSFIFFLLGILGMVLMMFFAKKMDSSDVKSNWIEQFTNGLSQICIFIGLLFLL